jgi:hypothetical protein
MRGYENWWVCVESDRTMGVVVVGRVRDELKNGMNEREKKEWKMQRKFRKEIDEHRVCAGWGRRRDVTEGPVWLKGASPGWPTK